MVPTTQLLDAWLHRREPRFADRPALATPTPGGWIELTYADLDRSSHRVAAWLATRGVGAGDRVAIAGEAGPDWVIALFGVWRRGAVATPLDARLGVDELGPILGRARPSVVITSAETGLVNRPVLRFRDIADLPDGPDVDTAGAAGDPALVVWTSGTSGAPKGVTLSLANIAYVVDAGRAAHGLDSDDRWLSVLPLNHMLELSCALLPGLATGASVAFAGTVSPREVSNVMAERRCTRLTLVPSLLAGLVADIEANVGRVSMWDGPTFHCGGAPLDPAVERRCERLGIPVYTGYGLTETAPTVAMNTPAARRHGSVGRPLPGSEVRIAEDGEILVRSPGVMVGYWEDVALTRTAVDGAGWLHTGDLGHLDADGFLHVTGRAKTLIVLATGKKVQPEEVEDALAASTLLAEACVVGCPGRNGEEQVGVAVVAAPSLTARYRSTRALAAAAEDEVARLTASLASFKRPMVVRVVPAPLPRTAKGSVRRSDVAALLDSRHPVKQG